MSPSENRGGNGQRDRGQWRDRDQQSRDQQSRDQQSRGQRGNRDQQSNRNQRGRQRAAARVRGDGNFSTQAPSQRSRNADPARTVAYDVLREVDRSDAYANLLLPKRMERAGLDSRDAAFATELTYGTLRGQGWYDAVLAHCVDRPFEELDGPIRDALRLGAHQLLGMRVPDHAAVAQTVGLVRHEIGTGPSGLVNAVLRKVAAHDADGWREIIGQTTEDPDALRAALTSHPQWVVRALRDALRASGRGSGAALDATLDAVLAADNVPAKVALAARPGLVDPDTLIAEVGGHATRGAISPYAVVLDGSDPGRIAAVADGLAGVQDEGSQLVAAALARVEITGPDARWLDMCAGPGGKTALLAALAARRGARVVANEVSPHRAGLVRENLRQAPEGSVEAVRVADGRAIGAEEPGAYDRILVDAPCTGLGALRRRPESRWRRHPADVSGLVALQTELLRSALDAVRPGGVVAYVTCSPHVAETTVPVLDAMRGRSDVGILDAWDVIDQVTVTPQHFSGRGEGALDARQVQLWPDLDGTDAMHLTLLRRAD